MSYRSTLAPLSVPAGFRLVWYQWAKGRRALGWVDTKEDPTRVIFSEEWSTPDDAVRHLLETEGVDCICETCGKKYYDHPMATEPKWLCYWDPENPRPYLHRLCNGKVVKL